MPKLKLESDLESELDSELKSALEPTSELESDLGSEPEVASEFGFASEAKPHPDRDPVTGAEI